MKSALLYSSLITSSCSYIFNNICCSPVTVFLSKLLRFLFKCFSKLSFLAKYEHPIFIFFLTCEITLIKRDCFLRNMYIWSWSELPIYRFTYCKLKTRNFVFIVDIFWPGCRVFIGRLKHRPYRYFFLTPYRRYKGVFKKDNEILHMLKKYCSFRLQFYAVLSSGLPSH